MIINIAILYIILLLSKMSLLHINNLLPENVLKARFKQK